MPQPRQYTSCAERQAAYRQRAAHARAGQLTAKGLPCLPAPSNLPGTQRWRSLLAQARWALCTVEKEMEAYYQARSPTWQEDEKGNAFQDKLQELAEIGAALEQFERDHFS